jgi:hypothetical protein
VDATGIVQTHNNTENVVILDETITCTNVGITYGNWMDTTACNTVAVFLDILGPSTVARRQTQFASEVNGGGVVAGEDFIQAIAIGQVYISADNFLTANVNQLGPHYPAVCGSLRMGFRAAAPAGVDVRIVYVGQS